MGNSKTSKPKPIFVEDGRTPAMISFEIDRAAQMLRALVNRIEPAPDGEEPAIVLRSDIAAILTFAAGKKSPPP